MRTLRTVTIALLLGFCFVSTASAQKTCEAATKKLDRKVKAKGKKETSFTRKMNSLTGKIEKLEKVKNDLCSGAKPEPTPEPTPAPQ